MIEVLRSLLFFIPGTLILVFGSYGIVILYYGKFRKKYEIFSKDNSDAEFEPFVSVIIPTHNEEIIISKKIENVLASSYPQEKLEIIFVDDSDDSTPNIIQKYSDKYPNISLITFHSRVGYSPSMIAGCKKAKGEILVFNDAGSFIDGQAIHNLIAHFKDPNIGVVTGKDEILNAHEEVGKSESLYQKIFNLLRIAETNMDSTFFIKGEATAVRKNLISDLDICSETFDTTVGLFVRKKGYRVIYEPKVKFYEYAPSTRSERVKQKTIRAANLIKVLWRFKSMIFKRVYGKYGCLILPLNFSLLVVVPIAIVSWFILLIMLTFLDLGFSAIIWGIIALVFLLFLMLSKHFVLTFLDFEYSLLKAICQVVFTRTQHDKIEKVASTRRL